MENINSYLENISIEIEEIIIILSNENIFTFGLLYFNKLSLYNK